MLREAIHRAIAGEVTWIASSQVRSVSNDDLPRHDFAISRRDSPEFCISFTLQSEGAGNTGCALHPRSRVRCAQKNAHEHTGSAETLRHSLRNGFTAYTCSPGDRLSCHRHPRKRSLLANLTPASGCRTTRLRRPHRPRSSVAPPRPPHPAPTSVTIAKRPSVGQDGGVIRLICRSESGIFFHRGLDQW